MKRIEFETYTDFVCEIADKIDAITGTDRYDDIAIISKYNDAKEILRELLCLGYEVASIHLDKEEYEEFWDEYIITITNIDKVAEVWCEPFKRNNKYLINNSVFTYIIDNCSSACIPNCKSEVVFEVGIGSECDCCECTCKDTDNLKDIHIDKTDTPTTPKALYSVNGKTVSKEEFLEIEKEFTKEFRGSLLSWCEIMDSMDEIRKLFRW